MGDHRSQSILAQRALERYPAAERVERQDAAGGRLSCAAPRRPRLGRASGHACVNGGSKKGAACRCTLQSNTTERRRLLLLSRCHGGVAGCARCESERTAAKGKRRAGRHEPSTEASLQATATPRDHHPALMGRGLLCTKAGVTAAGCKASLGFASVSLGCSKTKTKLFGAVLRCVVTG